MIRNKSNTESVTRNSPIGIFDSGAGGLTVVKQVQRLLPNENILYFGDTGRVPYGPRPLSQVRKFSLEISTFLHRQGAKALVIACNTATAAALTAIKNSLSIPVIGVVEPGAKAAFDVAGSKGKVGLIATQGTVDSNVYEIELTKLGLQSAVLNQACPEFVILVEQGMTDKTAVENATRKCTRVFRDQPVDVLILGCTHFPLLSAYIQKQIPKVKLIDPAIHTVKSLRSQLEENDLSHDPSTNSEYKFFCTGDPLEFKKNIDSILGSNAHKVEHVNLNS